MSKTSPNHYHAGSTLPVQRSYINGQYHQAVKERYFSTTHPGNGQKICDVEIAAQPEIDAAVAAASKAYLQWSQTPAAERAAILRQAAEMIRERNDELAQLETLDTGKAFSETSVEDIRTGAAVIEYFAGVTQSLHGQHYDLPPEAFAILRRESLGVCAGIGAWNYPMQIAMWKSGPALACGNTMIFKPAEQTPLTALKLAEIYSEAGIPDGVFNVVQGAAETGAALIEHAGISKVTLTGSVETGKKVMAAAAGGLKKVTLELGGKSPIVIFDDANLDNAVNAALAGNFYSTGQVCSNGTRVFVHRKIYTRFIDIVKARTERISIGDPFDPGTLMGPLVSEAHFNKVILYMKLAKASAARHVTGGEILEHSNLTGGWYVSPAVFADCTDDMKFVTDEVFGPLMAILPFDEEDEVVTRANATEFGLSAAVFTQDFSRAHRIANKLQAGSVWINDYNNLPPEIPFGGYKQSGIGRENGLQAIEYYTQLKTIVANMGDVPETY